MYIYIHIHILTTASSGEDMGALQGLTIGHTGAGSCVCFRRDGQAKFFADPRCPVPVHADRVNSVEYSPDGKRVVSASNDGFVTIWNAETGAEVRVLDRQPTGPNLLNHRDDLQRYTLLSLGGTARADDAQGTPAQSHVSPSILVHEGNSPSRMSEVELEFVIHNPLVRIH